MLEVNNLFIGFVRYGKGLSRDALLPIRSLDIQVRQGEVVAVVGESGAGKSLLAHAVLGLLPHNAFVRGQIRFKGELLTEERKIKLRGRKIALIPQSVSFLNPLRRIGPQARRAAVLSGHSPNEAWQTVNRAFERYLLGPEVNRMFAHQLSGGMARRVLTTMATAGRAELIIADEPTTGLDPQTIRESLKHLRRLADHGKAVMLITHDIAAALTIADKVAVFHSGTTVEVAPSTAFNGSAKLHHPYSRLLWRCMPQNSFVELDNKCVLSPNSGKGCHYLPICPQPKSRCQEKTPEIRQIENALVRCHYA
jgi:peptide/nickel transport system ATP-binding protein